MDVTAIVLAAAVIGVTGLFIGLLLGAAGKKFAVSTDEREQRIRELLPGNNCGGCGYAGCDALAKAIAAGEAPANGCPVADARAAREIGSLMGAVGEERERRTAFVKCGGICDRVSIKYHYYGIADCRKLDLIPGRGEKKCAYGCMGFGTCVRACPFHAISIVNGVARVDPEACRACGKCIGVCPNQLIEMIPYRTRAAVRCASHDPGRAVRAACRAGCIGCGLCVRQCGERAIELTDFLAHIDPKLCTGCGKCMEKCPAQVIVPVNLDENINKS